MPFNIIRNDITKMQVDTIVNAANTKLLMGEGHGNKGGTIRYCFGIGWEKVP